MTVLAICLQFLLTALCLFIIHPLDQWSQNMKVTIMRPLKTLTAPAVTYLDYKNLPINIISQDEETSKLASYDND